MRSRTGLSETRLPGLSSRASKSVGGIVEDPALAHAGHRLRERNVQARIALENQKVPQLARLQGAPRIVEPQVAGRLARGGVKRVLRRQSGRDERVHLLVQRQPRRERAVRRRGDGSSGGVELPHELAEHLQRRTQPFGLGGRAVGKEPVLNALRDHRELDQAVHPVRKPIGRSPAFLLQQARRERGAPSPHRAGGVHQCFAVGQRRPRPREKLEISRLAAGRPACVERDRGGERQTEEAERVRRLLDGRRRPRGGNARVIATGGGQRLPLGPLRNLRDGRRRNTEQKGQVGGLLVARYLRGLLHVDQPRHDPEAIGVEHLHVPRPGAVGRCAHARHQAVDHDEPPGRPHGSRAVDDVRVVDHDRPRPTARREAGHKRGC